MSISATSTSSLMSLRGLPFVFIYPTITMKKHASPFSFLINFSYVHIQQAEFDYCTVKIFTFLFVYRRNSQQESRCKRQSMLVVSHGGRFRARLGY